MTTNTTHTARTKLDARSETKVETAVTIDWTDMPTEALHELASRAIIIQAQANWRADGTIPTETTLQATDFQPGRKKVRKPADVMALIGKMSDEEKAALLAKLTA